MILDEIRITGRFRVDRLYKQGKYSQVFQGVNFHSQEKVAIKLEEKNARFPQVLFESQILKQLEDHFCVPSPYWSGPDGDFNCLVMEWAGRSLDDLLNECGGTFSLKTILMIADQAFGALEYIHDKGIIHRDLKPANMCMFDSHNQFERLKLIDFGLSKIYYSDEIGHIPEAKGKSILGTPLFSSISNHKGLEGSRRDDAESLMYILLYLLAGSLPWSDTSFEKDSSVYNKKYERMKTEFIDSPFWVNARVYKDHSRSALIGIPERLWEIFSDIRELGFEDDPSYDIYRSTIKLLMYEHGFDYNGIYDWTVIPQKHESIALIRSIEDTLETIDEIEDNSSAIDIVLDRYLDDDSINLDFDLKSVKRENNKYEIVPEDEEEEDMPSLIQKINQAGESATSRAKKKNGKDCLLI